MSDLAAAAAYPERREDRPAWHDRAAHWLHGSVAAPLAARLRDPARALADVLPHAADHRGLSDAALRGQLQAQRAALRRRRPLQPVAAGRCLGLLREVAARTLGQRPHDTQLMGAWALLQGRLAEMATGEGKTLTAALAAATGALAGMPTHVITVNDYLAARDAEAMGPVYRFAGLTVGCVVHGDAPEQRRAAYRCDVAYCTNKELAFDYLKDRVALMGGGGRIALAVQALRGAAAPAVLLRGLHFAIVDEADSILVDEARTPLILSAERDGGDERALHAAALDAARGLDAGADYALDERARRVELRDAGKRRVDAWAAGRDGAWTSARARHELVVQALTALHLFERDRHYVLRDGKVQIVDEFTGRVMADRSWENGLHQLIEAKEGCAASARRVTLARITYQRLFRRYLLLAGMTGTAREVRREVDAVYRLRTLAVPLHRPCVRVRLAPRLVGSADAKWQAVTAAVRRVAVGERRPVLLGTRSVEASEQLSRALRDAGIEHVLLNAKQDGDEAALVARAGEAGRVTVATNMAGRGTDIRLGDGVAARGGLHVILTECHAAARVDRQLFGRCARQGDPGSCETILARDDELLRLYAGALLPWVRGPRTLRLAVAFAQGRAQRREARVRRDTLAADLQLQRTLAFSGTHE